MRKNLLLLLLAAMFTMISCEKDKPSREIDPFIQSLQGTWWRYSLVHYDKEWEEIELVLIENGCAQLEGLGYYLYTFNTDGTITYYFEPVDPGVEPKMITCSCSYDPASKIITVKSGNGATIEYLVSSYDSEYLVLDYTEHLYDSYIDRHYYRYVRETLKRSQD